MPVKTKTKKVKMGELTPIDATILAGIVQAVNTLYRRHAQELDRIRSESEQDRITLTFPVEIDCTETTPSLKVGISYKQSYTDNVVSQLPEPGQEVFDFMTPDEAKVKLAEQRKRMDDGGVE